jgi:tetratricopeptide (TPR) repeat protein
MDTRARQAYLPAPVAPAEGDDLTPAPLTPGGLPRPASPSGLSPSGRWGIPEVLAGQEGTPPSLATRRQGALRRRRRNQVLLAIALALAIFPPMWAVYLVAWLVWRRRPRQQSMRRVRRAVRALRKGRAGTALRHLQDAHFRDPSNTDALYWMGLLLSRQHRQEEAEEVLSLVAERVPGLPEVEAALVDAYVALEQPESAVHHAQRLVHAEPYNSDALLKLSEAFVAAGRVDLAIEALRQSPLDRRVLSDALVDVHFQLGVLYERRGDLGAALHHLKRVYARDAAYRDVRARVLSLESRLGEPLAGGLRQ